MVRRLTSEDFLAGLLAALAQRDWRTISIRGDRFDKASAEAFSRLERLAPEHDIRLGFYVRPHKTYGDSSVIRDAIARLAMWDLISLDNPEYQDIRLKISPTYADSVFLRFGLDSELFGNLAESFVDAYERAPAATVN